MLWSLIPSLANNNMSFYKYESTWSNLHMYIDNCFCIISVHVCNITHQQHMSGHRKLQGYQGDDKRTI